MGVWEGVVSAHRRLRLTAGVARIFFSLLTDDGPHAIIKITKDNIT